MTQRLEIEGITFDVVTEREVVAHIVVNAAARQGGWVVTPNVDILVRSRRDPTLAAMVCSAELVVADGMPIVWAARLARTPLPERVAGSDLLMSLARAARDASLSVSLIGGPPGAAELAAARLRSEIPGVAVVGALTPPIGFDATLGDISKIKAHLDADDPAIVFVGLGFPKQELLIRRLRQDYPHMWFLGIGGGIDMLSGQVSRSPGYLQKLGLEWLYRLLQEPKRLARRYLADDVPFALGMIMRALLRGLRRPALVSCETEPANGPPLVSSPSNPLVPQPSLPLVSGVKHVGAGAQPQRDA
jgi:N-acetylglucosaminyldiphosphoundecaprenol N-acetyl-beta-D-mannosaminyltransferase